MVPCGITAEMMHGRNRPKVSVCLQSLGNKPVVWAKVQDWLNLFFNNDKYLPTPHRIIILLRPSYLLQEWFCFDPGFVSPVHAVMKYAYTFEFEVKVNIQRTTNTRKGHFTEHHDVPFYLRCKHRSKPLLYRTQKAPDTR